MTDRAAHPKTKTEEATVMCRRVKRLLPLAEHATCSYCYGKLADIATGDYQKFCDFEEGKDPIHFGFPET